MKCLLDENVSPLVERELASLGHVCCRLARGTPDKDLLAWACNETAVIISHDKDFLTLPASLTEGILLLRIHPPWAKDVNESLRAFLRTTPPDAWRGKLVLLERDGFHIRC